MKLRPLPGVVAFAPAVGDLAVDLGLPTVPFNVFAVDVCFESVDPAPGAI